MGRQRSAVGAPFLPLGLGRGFRRVVLVLLRILLGDRRLDILQRQLHLLVIKPFGPPPKLRALKLPQEVVKPIVLLPSGLSGVAVWPRPAASSISDRYSRRMRGSDGRAPSKTAGCPG